MPRLLALACLATLPPELLAQARGWAIVDPAYLGLTAAWWPVELACRLGVLKQLALGGKGRGVLAVMGGALAMEVLLSLRLADVALAGLVPAAAALAYSSVDALARRSVVLALAGLTGLCLLPAFVYFLARALSPLLLLQRQLSPGAALNASAGLVRGRWRAFLGAVAPWVLAAWCLEGASLALPDAFGLGLAPLSFLAEARGLAAAWKALGSSQNA